MVYDKINEDKYIIDIINKIPDDLILKDYITFYLDKNNFGNFKNSIFNKIIELLLKLRFNKEKNQTLKNNQNYPIKLLLKK